MFDSTLLTAIVAILVVTILLIIVATGRRPSNFPPGPPRWPLFGNSFQVFPNGRKNGVEMSKKYGPILGLKFGSYWAVMLNNAHVIREFLSKSEFAGRYGYNPFLEENINADTKGVVMSSGKRWSDLRRFTMRTLRDFGLGKRSLESIIQEEIQELLGELRQKHVGHPFSPSLIFNASVLNIIWSIVAGDRYKLGDEKLDELIQAVFEVFNAPVRGGFLRRFNSMFPAVVEFRQKFNLNSESLQSRFLAKFLEFLQKSIQQHVDTLQPGSPRDFIDCFLEEYSTTGQNLGSTNKDEDNLELVAILMDLFGAGSETTSTTLNWAFYLLAFHQDVQEALYQEIKSVVGDRQIQLDDRVNLPMAEAVMAETYRISTLAAFGVPHAAIEDVFIMGYRIPKNTMIMANLYSAHYSPDTWGDPNNFRPNRHLSEDGKKFTKHPDIMPFSVGKRQCLGESLARDEFFLFLVNIVQQLKMEFPNDEPPHSLEPVIGLVLMPEPHRLLFHDRNA